MAKKKLSPQQRGWITRRENAAMFAEFQRLAARDAKRAAQKKSPARAQRKQTAQSRAGVGREFLPSPAVKRKGKALKKAAPLPTSKTKKQTRKETATQRERRERALRGAETRKLGGKKITSRTTRRTVATMRAGRRGKEIAFEFVDILRGRNKSNPDVRTRFESGTVPHIGKDMQITFMIRIENEKGEVKIERSRHVVRNFRGVEDIARLVGPAVRYFYDVMEDMGASFNEVYISSVSLATLASGE